MTNEYKLVERNGKQEKWAEMIPIWVEMDRKSSQTVIKSKRVAIDKKQRNVRKWADKKQKIVLNQLAKDTRLNEVFKLVLSLSKVIPDIRQREIYVKGI